METKPNKAWLDILEMAREMRAHGCAVAIIFPDDMRGIDSEDIENQMLAIADDFIRENAQDGE